MAKLVMTVDSDDERMRSKFTEADDEIMLEATTLFLGDAVDAKKLPGG